MKRGVKGDKGRRSPSGRLATLRSESGQSIVLVTLMMFLILGICAYVFDAAELAAAHHRAQLAADAAALAAAQDLEVANPVANTVTTDGQNAGYDNYANSNVSITEESDQLHADASVSAPVSLPFGRVFGFGNGGVTAKAVARVNTAVANVDGTILSVGCGNSTTSNCTYCADGTIPTGATQADDGWEVTDTAEEETTGEIPATNNTTGANCKTTTAGEPTVNLQTCQGSQGSGNCYAPGSNSPESTDDEVVDLNGQTEGGMWQTVSTTPGARYVLNFWLTGNPGLNGWPGPTNNYFPLDVYITSGSGAANAYTPTYAEASPPLSPCSSNRPSNYVDCGWWNYQDEECGYSGVTLTGCSSGWEQADFTEESLTFFATSTSTTITFNSEVYDNDATDTSQNKGWYFCGPEVENITLGYPELQITQ